MDFAAFINSPAMPYLLPVLIFFSRIFDVSLGTLRIITQKKAKELVQYFRAEGYHVTDIKATSNSGSVDVVYLNLRRRDLKTALEMVKIFNPDAIYTITDMRLASKGMYPGWKRTGLLKQSHRRFLFKSGRKSK